MVSIQDNNLKENKGLVVFSVPEGKDITFVDKQKKEIDSKPPFFMIGSGETNKKGTSMDLLDIMGSVSKAGQFLILKIKDGINRENDYHYIVHISKATLSKTEQRYLVEGYKELNKLDVVRRVKNGYYMLNPNALMTKDYEKALDTWATLGNKAKKKTDQPEG